MTINFEMEFPLTDYLKRIGLDSAPTLDLEGLKQLHRAQFFAIPFENLDIQLGKEIGLDSRTLVEKLIHGQRGGYCFELNGLLLMALKTLGFNARPLLARVHLDDPPSGRTHQLNAVELGSETWLVDAGFGAGGPRIPMLLKDGWTHRQDGYGIRISKKHPYGWIMQSRESTWKDSYSFEDSWVSAADIEVANFYTSHSPQSHFTTMRTISKPITGGRISLANQVLTVIQGDSKRVLEVDESETLNVLAREFGLDLAVEFSDFLSVGD
jgi:N-hydroxyarylamine O-acetyltransferase